MLERALPVAGLTAVALVVAGCPGTSPPSECVSQTMTLEASPLTLLSGARIDHVGDFFVLLGTDGSVVRWARLGMDGQIGDWHEAAVPAHTDGPWFAVAGTDGPADHLVVAYAAGGATAAATADLMTFSVQFDNSGSTPPEVVGQIPDVRSSPLTVAMVSGRGGMHAGLTWAVQGTTDVSARILDGDGHVVGDALTVASMIGGFNCLRFSPGKLDMMIGYVDLSGTPSNPTFVGTEIDDAGVPQPGFRIAIGRDLPGCVEVVPTSTGYGLAWHASGIGVIFGVDTPPSPAFPNQLVLSDVSVTGGPPSLGGLGWTGKNYSLVFNHVSGGEVWEIDATGQQIGGALVFPSRNQRTGALSTQPVGTALYATYADYTGADPTDLTAGQRILVKVSCP